MTPMLQLICHLWGDYVLQSDWMAQRKTASVIPAAAHAIVYSLGFMVCLLLTQSNISWSAIALVCWSHFLIDHFRLARYIVWAKNFLAPPFSYSTERVELPEGCTVLSQSPDGRILSVKLDDGVIHTFETIGNGEFRKAFIWWRKWSECAGTGYHKSNPLWLSVWLLIIADNTLHITINFLAFHFFQ